MCCMRLAENTGCKNSPSAHHRTTLSGYIFTTKAFIENPGKNLLNSNISSTGRHNMVNFAGWDQLVSLGHPGKFQRVLRLGFVNPVYRLHDTTSCQSGCQTRLTTGWRFVYMIQHCQTSLTTGCIVYTVGCQTGCTTGLTTGCIV